MIHPVRLHVRTIRDYHIQACRACADRIEDALLPVLGLPRKPAPPAALHRAEHGEVSRG